MLLGRLGNDPIHRETKNGVDVAQFSLATSRKFQSSAEDSQLVEETQWHRVVVWGKLAQACSQYLKKGQAAFVSGEIRTRKFSKDGQDRLAFEIHADEVSFLNRKLNQTEALAASA